MLGIFLRYIYSLHLLVGAQYFAPGIPQRHPLHVGVFRAENIPPLQNWRFPEPQNMEYDGILRELRCAFACGSGMVELYNDYKLMNEINGGQLWKDLADCVKWQEANADVLPDIHWVGGNPWDGKKANIYGWAAWNGKKAVLTLRNPAASPQSIKLTLRQALEIPDYVKGSVTLSDGFEQQPLQGLPTGTPIQIDEELTIEMPASSVYIYNGPCK